MSGAAALDIGKGPPDLPPAMMRLRVVRGGKGWGKILSTLCQRRRRL